MSVMSQFVAEVQGSAAARIQYLANREAAFFRAFAGKHSLIANHAYVWWLNDSAEGAEWLHHLERNPDVTLLAFPVGY